MASLQTIEIKLMDAKKIKGLVELFSKSIDYIELNTFDMEGKKGNEHRVIYSYDLIEFMKKSFIEWQYKDWNED